MMLPALHKGKLEKEIHSSLYSSWTQGILTFCVHRIKGRDRLWVKKDESPYKFTSSLKVAYQHKKFSLRVPMETSLVG